MALSLKVFKKIYDQVNPLDNGKTYKNPQGNAPAQQKAGLAAPSAFRQLTHNGITNTVGNVVVKPFVINPAQIFGETGRMIAADVTNNRAAQHASQNRQAANLHASIPGAVVDQVVKGGQATANLAFKAPILSIQGKNAAAARARQIGLQEFNATAPGQLVSPIERGIINLTHADKKKVASVGLDPNATGAQQYVASPVSGALGTIGLAKGGGKSLDYAAEHYTPLNQAGAVGANVATAGKIVPKTKAVMTPTPELKPITTTSAPAKISGFDKAVRSTSDVLNKIDPRLGKMVYDRRELAETTAAQAKARLKVTNSLNKAEGTNLARVLKGTEKPLNDKVAQAAVESRKELNSVYFRAKHAGITVPGYRKNYFPQIHNPKVYQEGTALHKDAVAHLLKTGQAKTDTEAINVLRQKRNTKSMSPYGNLAKSRHVDLPGYAENIQALHRYLDRSYASIAHSKVMGKDDKVLNKVLAEVRNNGGDYEQAIKSYRQASGIDHGSVTGERISRVATNIQGATKLGLSAIGNATQSANTAIVGGVGRTGKNLVKQFSKAEREFVKKTGVSDEQVAHEALFGEQGVSSKIRNVTAPLFEQVEKSNRATAALTGRDVALDLAKKAKAGNSKAAKRLNDEFGITNFQKGLSEADQIKAARKMVERTQFRTGPQDLPGWATTPTGRVVSQFKRYPYKQAQFLKREVIDQARKGNLAPAGRLATVGAPVALASNYAQDKARGAAFDQSPAEKALDIANIVTGNSLVTSIPQSLYPNAHDANSYITKAVKALGGPTISDATRAIQAGYEGAQGKATNAERFALTHIPVIGTPASNRLLPYANSTTGSSGGSSKGAADKELSPTERAKAAFSSKAGQDFLKLSTADRIAAANSDPDARELLKEYNAMKAAFAAPKLYSEGLDDDSLKTLKRFDKMSATARKTIFAREPEAEYNYNLATYNNKKAAGGYTDAQDINAQQSLAKQYVGAAFTKSTRDIYGLSKAEVAAYVKKHPEAAGALIAYDRALVAAHIIKKVKFDGSFDSSSSSSSSGYKGESSLDNPYRLSLSRPTATFRKGSARSTAATGPKKFTVKAYKPVKKTAKLKRA